MKAPARTALPSPFSLLLLIVTLAALLAAGCGDDGGESSADDDASTTTSQTAGGGAGAPDCDGGADAGETGPKSWKAAPEFTIDEGEQYTAELTTSKGVMTAELLPKEGPCAVNNFVFLAREGYYDGVPFHRIIKDFMVQTGDPTGTGRGGPGYTITDDEVDLDYEPGTLAMANTGAPDTAGSQFFIVHGTSVSLPKTYTIFGRLTGGEKVLDAIASVPVEDNGMGEPSKPQQPVKLTKVTITES